jgi:hypothetical protein
MRKTRTIAAALAGLALTGCATTRQFGGPPTVHTTSGGPLWVTREVSAAREGDLGPDISVAYGLFACYPHADGPGEPVCYLAKYVTASGREVKHEDARVPHAR